ncbi:Glyoxalase/bleomycin resistance protein/dioxygenase [Sarocladium strictum]
MSFADTPPLSVISLFVEDLPAAKTFYTNIFNATIAFEDNQSCGIRLKNLLINLLVTTSAGELVGGQSNVASPTSGKRFQMTVFVDDVEADAKLIQDKGVVLTNGPEIKPWGVKVINFEDPAGHSWEVAQQMD